MGRIAGLVLLVAALASPVAADVPVTLRGSWAAMERQHGVALDLGYVFVQTPGELAELVEDGRLVRLHGNDDYTFRRGVRTLVARPEMRLFIERLGAAYRRACGERLVVTSLTRPVVWQPPNAHRLSVHPAGIAADLRVPRTERCQVWLETTLLAMETERLLDVTREFHPPHYHLALFPTAFMDWMLPALEAERARAAGLRSARLAAAALPRLTAPTVEVRPSREPTDRGPWELTAALAVAALLMARVGVRR